MIMTAVKYWVWQGRKPLTEKDAVITSIKTCMRGFFGGGGGPSGRQATTTLESMPSSYRRDSMAVVLDMLGTQNEAVKKEQISEHALRQYDVHSF